MKPRREENGQYLFENDTIDNGVVVPLRASVQPLRPTEDDLDDVEIFDVVTLQKETVKKSKQTTKPQKKKTGKRIKTKITVDLD
mmetsp:Transcript_6790/g.25335  ORF Transcript_6790/g.25335 Transcript_6790/m.25335 type:complete len:84 (-) Transcript_6790:138-389(-)